MHNNLHVEQYDIKEFKEWVRLVTPDRAHDHLRRAGLSKSMAYKLILGTYPHRVGKLGMLAIKKAMLRR